MNNHLRTDPAAEARDRIRRATTDDPGLVERIKALLAGTREEAMLEMRRCSWSLFRRRMQILLPAADAYISRTEEITLARVGEAMWQPADKPPPPHLHLQPLLVWLNYTDDPPGRRWPAIGVYEASGWILAGGTKARVTHWRPAPITDPQPRPTEERDPIEEEAERYDQQ